MTHWNPGEEDTCNLTTGRRNETEWVARYNAPLPEAKALELQADPSRKKLLQKTRTCTLRTFSSNHAAFLGALEWLWEKHCFHCDVEMPAEVRAVLAKTECHKKGGTNVCAEAMAALERREACQPPPPLPENRASSKLEDARLSSSAPLAKQAAKPEVDASKQCPLLSEVVPVREAFQWPKINCQSSEIIPMMTFRKILVPPDGNCLFAAAAVGKIMFNKVDVPSTDETAMYGRANRQNQVKWIEKALADGGKFPSNGPLLATSIRSCTDLDPKAYVKQLQSGELWGGWLECCIMGTRWDCQFEVYIMEKDGIKLISQIGRSKCKRKVRLLWSNDHYDLLLPAR